MTDVLVIGGGITGCAVLWTLARYTVSVRLLERADDLATGATKANSAIVHGGYAEPHEKWKGRLCYEGRRQFPALERQLGFGFKPIGSLVLAFDAAQRQELVALMDNGIRNGLTDLELLEGSQVRQMEPNVNPAVQYALYCRGAGVCSPFGLAYAMAENALANGAEICLRSGVVAMERTAEGFAVRTSDGRVHRARYVVNAGGLDAAQVARLVEDASFSIHPRGGEYLLMRQGTGSLVRRVLFQMPTRMGKGILVTPTVYGNLLIGPDAVDAEVQSRDTHPERLRQVYAQAQLTTDKLDIGQFLRSFAGVRPVSDTDDFILERSAVPGLIHAAGIQSPGLTAAPAVAARVRDLLADAGLALTEKTDYIAERSAYVSSGEPLVRDALEERLARPEGASGRMLCRCEQVPEEAVRDAARRGLPLWTVDAVKRRVRAGMGLCQGAFCRPRTAALLSHLQGADISAQTDAERDGLSRVGRQEMLAYLLAHPLMEGKDEGHARD